MSHDVSDGGADSAATGAGHDHDATLEQQFQHFLSTAREANADGTITFAEARHLASDFATMICTTLNDLGDPVAGADRLISAAEKAFDEYIEPLDIVGIPPALEKIADKALRSTIRPMVNLAVEVLS